MFLSVEELSSRGIKAKLRHGPSWLIWSSSTGMRPRDIGGTMEIRPHSEVVWEACAPILWDAEVSCRSILDQNEGLRLLIWYSLTHYTFIMNEYLSFFLWWPYKLLILTTTYWLPFFFFKRVKFCSRAVHPLFLRSRYRHQHIDNNINWSLWTEMTYTFIWI